MDWFDALRLAATIILRRHGLVAASAALFVEEAGIPLPILPGDVLMLVIGIQARQGIFPLWLGLLALEAVTVAGSTILYLVSKRAGRGLLLRYGRFLNVTPARLAQAERWVQERGAMAVIAGRLVPGLRIATAIGCGVLDVPLRTFVPAVAVGGFLYILLYTLLGYYLGQTALLALERVHLPLEVVGSAAFLLVAALWIRAARRHLARPVMAAGQEAPVVARHRRLMGGLAAGAAGMLMGVLLLNVLVPLAGDLASLAPGTLAAAIAARTPADLVRRSNPVALFSGIISFVLTGVIWGGVYGLWIARRLRHAHLPDALSGLLFAVLPLVVSAAFGGLLVDLKVIGQRPAMTVLAGDVVYHVMYGLALGLTYPVFAARRGLLALLRPGAVPLPLAAMDTVPAEPSNAPQANGTGRTAPAPPPSATPVPSAETHAS